MFTNKNAIYPPIIILDEIVSLSALELVFHLRILSVDP